VSKKYAIQVLLAISQKWLLGTAPPVRQDPGEFLVEMEKKALPEPVYQRLPTA
jgi:hypothetical protein